MKSSTYDRDNDEKDGANSAVLFKGAWWYSHCQDNNLNGEYGTDSARGIIRHQLHGYQIVS